MKKKFYDFHLVDNNLRLVVEQIKSFNLLSTHLGLTQILCLIVFKVIFTEEYDTLLKLFKCLFKDLWLGSLLCADSP